VESVQLGAELHELHGENERSALPSSVSASLSLLLLRQRQTSLQLSAERVPCLHFTPPGPGLAPALFALRFFRCSVQGTVETTSPAQQSAGRRVPRNTQLRERRPANGRMGELGGRGRGWWEHLLLLPVRSLRLRLA
jgi:hypothetical protein